MTNQEKVERNKAVIEKLEKRIAADREKIAKMKSENEQLETLEFKDLFKQLDMPLSEARSLLSDLISDRAKQQEEPTGQQ